MLSAVLRIAEQISLEGSRMIQIAKPDAENHACCPELAILSGNRFRDAYHVALDLADKNPAAQQTAARGIIEEYFRLESISSIAPLDRNSLYFAEKPIRVNGVYKFLVPGTVNKELIKVPLFLL